MQSIESVLRDANYALEGSPYSLDVSEAGKQRLSAVLLKVSAVQESLSQLPENDALSVGLRRILRTRDVFESNAIEGAGLPLSETDQVLEKYPVGREPTEEFVRWAVTKGIEQDRRTYEVIGLDAARRLANDVAADFSRPLSESDLRSLHKIIMGDAGFAGKYKEHVNAIAGSDHEPPLPIDTPAHMRELSDWLTSLPTRSFRTVGSIIRSAAAHAWLAHIHPFEDGNGRLARLLANIMLSREGMPPLILRNKGDRARYLDALALSDSAGDLSRLISVFSSALERVATQLADPERATRLFEEDINIRRSGLFPFWEKAMQDWSSAILAEHRLWSLNAMPVGQLTPSDFTSLRDRESVSRTWYLEVLEVGETRGVWYFGYTSPSLYQRLERDQVHPVLRYAVKNPEPNATKPFAPHAPLDGSFVEFMLEPSESVVYSSDTRGKIARFSLDMAAKIMAAISHEYPKR